MYVVQHTTVKYKDRVVETTASIMQREEYYHITPNNVRNITQEQMAVVGNTDYTVSVQSMKGKTSGDLVRRFRYHCAKYGGSQETGMLAGENDLAIHPPAASS